MSAPNPKRVDCYRWRYQHLLDVMNEIALTGNQLAMDAVRVVERRNKSPAERDAEMLALLDGRHMTVEDMMEATGLSMTPVKATLLRLKAARSASVQSFRGPAAAWTASSSPSIARPIKSKRALPPPEDTKPRKTMSSNLNYRSDLSRGRINQILKIASKQLVCAVDVAAEIYLSKNLTRRYLIHLEESGALVESHRDKRSIYYKSTGVYHPELLQIDVEVPVRSAPYVKPFRCEWTAQFFGPATDSHQATETRA